MRKLTWGLAVGALCAAVACGGMCESEIKKPEAEPRLVLVSQERLANWAHVCIAYDAETKVMYMIARNGSVTPMLNAQGGVLLYTEE